MNVVISGASRGIGKELAKLYLKRGDTVLMLSRNLEYLRHNKKEFSEFPGKVFIKKCDIRSGEEVKSAQVFSDLFMNEVDILILNAGVAKGGDLRKFKFRDIREVLEVNLIGTIRVMHQFINKVKQSQNGRIAIISSLADVRGFPGHSPYSASKAALSQIAEAASIELVEENIKVINIRPGFVKTEMTTNNKFKMPFIITPQKAAEKIIKGIDTGRRRVEFPLVSKIGSSLIKLMPHIIFKAVFNKYR